LAYSSKPYTRRIGQFLTRQIEVLSNALQTVFEISSCYYGFHSSKEVKKNLISDLLHIKFCIYTCIEINAKDSVYAGAFTGCKLLSGTKTYKKAGLSTTMLLRLTFTPVIALLLLILGFALAIGLLVWVACLLTNLTKRP
jgi:hypothetical protein